MLELRDISSMAMEYFDEKIAPNLKLYNLSSYPIIMPTARKWNNFKIIVLTFIINLIFIILFKVRSYVFNTMIVLPEPSGNRVFPVNFQGLMVNNFIRRDLFKMKKRTMAHKQHIMMLQKVVTQLTSTVSIFLVICRKILNNFFRN